MDYLLVAHDPTLTTPVAQTGSMAKSSPNGVRIQDMGHRLWACVKT
jgi:hypothetical protein